MACLSFLFPKGFVFYSCCCQSCQKTDQEMGGNCCCQDSAYDYRCFGHSSEGAYYCHEFRADCGTEAKGISICCRPDKPCCYRSVAGRDTFFCCDSGHRSESNCCELANCCKCHNFSVTSSCCGLDRRCALPCTEAQPFAIGCCNIMCVGDKPNNSENPAMTAYKTYNTSIVDIEPKTF